MAAVDAEGPVREVRGGQRISLPLFSLTLLLSAFLLFSVQPFFAKMVLPRLGGSPGVWSVAMVFFQAMLLAGYFYAHVLTTRLSLKHAAWVHAAVLAVAFIALPIAIPAGWDTPPETGQAWWLLALFAVSVGLPFFAVSANGPLLQAWFSRTGHPHAADPYFLYGASNLGSFASLILYIVFFEPLFAVSTQSILWTGGFLALACLIVACAFVALGGTRAEEARPVGAAAVKAASTRVGAGRKALWVVYAFVPSGLLVAVTAHISTDVAAAPFLWVVPLALFLLTFVFAFQRRPFFSITALSRLVPLFGALAITSIYAHGLLPIWFSLSVHLCFFFAAAMLAHSLLVAARPPVEGLTGFYMWMSVGGVLGGVFASLISPLIFNWVAEYLLLIVGTMMLRPELWRSPKEELLAFAGVAVAAICAILALAAYGIPMLSDSSTLAILILAMALAAAIIQFLSAPALALCLAMLVPVAFLHASANAGIFSERTFFGVVKVTESASKTYRVMLHGTTLHGAMRVADEGRPEPLTYYHSSGGIAAAIKAMQARRGGAMEQVGAVGLGTGSAVCHSMPGERWTTFEIDRSVADAARNPALFRFMPVCGPDVPVIIGDARLTLGREADGAYDLLLIDAFSSDSIPVHLMTREAFALYRSKLKADGVIVVHISNRYLELESVLAAIAQEEGLEILSGRFGGQDPGEANSYVAANHVAVLANERADFGPLLEDPRWGTPQAGDTQAWTDDFSNVFTALLRRF